MTAGVPCWSSWPLLHGTLETDPGQNPGNFLSRCNFPFSQWIFSPFLFKQTFPLLHVLLPAYSTTTFLMETYRPRTLWMYVYLLVRREHISRMNWCLCFFPMLVILMKENLHWAASIKFKKKKKTCSVNRFLNLVIKNMNLKLNSEDNL